jgi:hypothetical protein
MTTNFCSMLGVTMAVSLLERRKPIALGLPRRILIRYNERRCRRGSYRGSAGEVSVLEGAGQCW